MLRLYNTALLPLRLAAEAWARIASLRDPGSRAEWDERLARRPARVPPGGVWIHGSSVGEARLVTSLAAAVRLRRPELPISVSAYTRTGRPRLPSPPAVHAAFHLPLDFPGLPGRVLDAVGPLTLALVETELWPNLLRECEERFVPVVVLNGRLSARRMGRYRRLAGLYAPLMRGLDRVGAQSERDAERFVSLGVPESSVEVTGNLKYDLSVPAVDAANVRGRLGVPQDRPVVVAGSTGSGEEESVLDAYAAARRAHPQLLLILAPRHPERLDDVERLVRSRGLEVDRLSAAGPQAAPREVLLVDTMGELSALYQTARVAFVGGSLVPVGGHNLLEPAAVGVPVVYGPHTQNVVEPAAALEAAGGGLRVQDAADLGRALENLLGDDARREEMGRRAEEVVRANRGALERSVSLLLSCVDRRASRQSPEGA